MIGKTRAGSRRGEMTLGESRQMRGWLGMSVGDRRGDPVCTEAQEDEQMRLVTASTRMGEDGG